MTGVGPLVEFAGRTVGTAVATEVGITPVGRTDVRLARAEDKIGSTEADGTKEVRAPVEKPDVKLAKAEEYTGARDTDGAAVAATAVLLDAVMAPAVADEIMNEPVPVGWIVMLVVQVVVAVTAAIIELLARLVGPTTLLLLDGIGYGNGSPVPVPIGPTTDPLAIGAVGCGWWWWGCGYEDGPPPV